MNYPTSSSLSGAANHSDHVDPKTKMTEFGIRHHDLDDLRLLSDLLLHNLKLKHYSGPLRHGADRQDYGGYASIWRTRHPATGEWVAVKVMKTLGDRKLLWRRNLRIFREAKAWRSLKHPNILELRGVWFGFGPADGTPCLVAPWCEDGNLQSFLKRNPELSYHERVSLVADVARGLNYLHTRSPQVIHGDIKSDNVLVRKGRACLCDFGISTVVDGSSGATTGPYRYHRWSAPEIRISSTSSGRATTYSDVYALGGLILHAMTGREPYFGLSNGRVHNTVMNYETPDKHISQQVMDSLPAGYEEIMLRCWDLDPHGRPSSSDLLDWLENCVGVASASRTWHAPVTPSKSKSSMS